MFVPTNRVEPTSPNTHADLTSIKERRINSTSRPIEDVNSGKNEVLFNEKKTLKRHLGLFSGISFILDDNEILQSILDIKQIESDLMDLFI
ncbi:unnamed protein product [Rotaria sordida]|uniref:Uncharacterized protein n=1 Tax=Rotaria sordida TaxID=392033 RepID=A0A814NE74_9BILA|nr:unnamed protein product [Rotaria sordida]